jgi:peroxiredoxin
VLEAGTKAPAFTLPDQDGNELSLSDLSGETVGPDGKIAEAFPKVSPKTHDDVVLKALAELAAT